MKNKSDILNLLNYLTFKTDNYALGIHFCGSTNVNEQIARFEELSGKKPAFIDYDMHSLPFRPKAEIEGAIKELVAYAEGDGFITISNHWITPKVNYRDANEQGANNCRFELTREEYLSIMQEGTDLNRNFTDELKLSGEFLKSLKDKGVSVIYRPLHEGNAGWFWWGINHNSGITGEDVAELYRFVYNYLMDNYELDNVIWQHCNAICSADHFEWYPGDEYVDMYSTDWYISKEENDDPKCLNGYQNIGEHMLGGYKGNSEEAFSRFGEKPFAVAEYGGDGSYSADTLPIKQTLSTIDAHIEMGAKMAFLGLYFNLGEQDFELSPLAITLDQMADYRKKAAQ